MNITSKGQVTFAEAVRERHGFLPGTEVQSVEDGGVVRLAKAHGNQSRGCALVERMRVRATTPRSTDEIMALTRGERQWLRSWLTPTSCWMSSPWTPPEPWSSGALAEAAETHLLAINPIIFAEVSTAFDRPRDVDAALPGELQ